MCFYWIVGHSFYFIKRMWHCCLWLFDGLLCTMLCLVTQSSLTLCGAMDCSQPGFSLHGDSPGKNTGVGCHALLKGIFPIQGSNPGLLHCRQILYHLSHQGSPRILEWVAYPLSRGSSWHRNQTRLSCTACLSFRYLTGLSKPFILFLSFVVELKNTFRSRLERLTLV